MNIKDSLWQQCGVISIDHMAVTTSDFIQVLNDYMGMPGCELLRGPGTNKSQNVDYAFVRTAQNLVIEILGVKEDSPISEHVKNGGGAYHLCFVVKDLDAAIQTAKKKSALIIVAPREDDVFDGRRVSFMMHPKHGLFEFLEAYPNLGSKNKSSQIAPKSRQVISDELTTDSHEIQLIIKAFNHIFTDVDVQFNIKSAQLGVTPEWDSLKQLQLVMEVEKLTGTKFTVEELSSAVCFDDFVQIVESSKSSLKLG